MQRYYYVLLQGKQVLVAFSLLSLYHVLLQYDKIFLSSCSNNVSKYLCKKKNVVQKYYSAPIFKCRDY